ncbi:hypothetical protein BH18ACT6_BH18ACT6_22210 [soil metagenome]
MKSHRFDPWSFIFGLVLVVVGLFFLTTTSLNDLVSRLNAALDLGLPILALVIGAALVVPALRRPKPAAPLLTPEETVALEELNDTVPPAS